MKDFEHYLEKSLAQYEEGPLKEAMAYALLANGKRIRPQLVFACAKGFGINERKAYAYACALEYIHTYSLIHDDLPAMDNDELRRGKPTVHIAFGEDLAILAGDALLTEAFHQALQNDLSASQNQVAISILSQEAGANGMVLGQVMDMKPESLHTQEIIETMLEKKTGRLLEAALELGAIVSERMEALKDLKEAGKMLGLAFQIQDDILDIEKSAKELGKSNSDDVNNKQTIARLIGLEPAKELERQYYYRGIEILESISNFDVKPLKDLIQSIEKRQY